MDETNEGVVKAIKTGTILSIVSITVHQPSVQICEKVK